MFIGRAPRIAFTIAWAFVGIIGSLILASATLPLGINPGAPTFPFGTTIALLIFVGIDLLVLWILRRFISPKSTKTKDLTSFRATYKGLGATLVATAVGAVGSFLTILAVLVTAAVIISHFVK
jgi:membrane protein implicated in regulation of membrane protease activity